MARLLAALDRADSRQTGIVRRRGDLRRRLAAATTALLLVAAIGGAVSYKQFGVRITSDGVRVRSPLGTPPEVATGLGSFSFVHTQPASDRPVAYDPCRSVEYRVNDALAPDGGHDLLVSAIAEISAATGLQFVAVGATDDLPRRTSATLAPRRGPVLIAWTTPEVVADLAGRVAGVAGSTARKDELAGELEYLTGMVALDAPQLTGAMEDPQGAGHVRAIIVHELGHLVGLAHVDDPGELMHGDNVGRLELGPGDREGLAALGAGRCFH